MIDRTINRNSTYFPQLKFWIITQGFGSFIFLGLNYITVTVDQYRWLNHLRAR